MKTTTKSSQKSLIDRFSALGDKTRFRLLSLLSTKSEICVSELAEEIGISTAGVSQQLKVLENAGLVVRQRNGQRICYQVKTDDPLNKELIELIKEGETK